MRTKHVYLSTILVGVSVCMCTYIVNAITLQQLEAQDKALGNIGGSGVGALSSNCYFQLHRYGCDIGNVHCTPKIDGAGNGAEGGGLNPEFACRLVKYFQAHPTQRIVSAYRSYAKQQAMCGSGGKGCAPAGASCHQYGLAVDVAGIQLGVKQKELGLIRAYSGPHLQCEENSTASCSPQTIPCSGKFTDDPRNNQQHGTPMSQKQPAAGSQQVTTGGESGAGPSNESGSSPATGGGSPQQQAASAPPQQPSSFVRTSGCADNPRCTSSTQAASYTKPIGSGNIQTTSYVAPQYSTSVPFKPTQRNIITE